MAVYFFDGMNVYAIGQDDSDLIEAGYLVSGTNIKMTADGRYGGNAVRMNNSAGWLRKNLDVSADLWVIQGWLKCSTLPSSPAHFIQFQDSAARVLVALRITGDGRLKLYDADGYVGQTAAGKITNEQYHYFEFKVAINDCSGSAAVRIDGTLIFNQGSIDTSYGSNPDRIILSGTGPDTNQAYWDDLILINDLGGSGVAKDWIGRKRVLELKGIADTSQEDWSRSAGSDSYSLLNENIPGDHDGDLTYINDDTPGQETRIELEKLGVGPAIFAVNTLSAARETEADGTALRHTLKSGASTYESGDIDLETTYQTDRTVWELDPNGDIDWTVAAVNAVREGVKLVSV